MAEFIGITDRPPDTSVVERHALAPALIAGSLAALRFAAPAVGADRRVAAVLELRRDIPRLVPLAQAALDGGAMRAIMMRYEALFRSDLSRLTGLSEIVVSLSYPAPPRPEERARSGLRYLRDRAAYHRATQSLARRAFDHLAGLADVAGQTAEGQHIAPFTPAQGPRVGADLALLVPDARLGALHGALARHAARRIPREAGAVCHLTGPFPPFSFVTPLTGEDTGHAVRDTGT